MSTPLTDLFGQPLPAPTPPEIQGERSGMGSHQSALMMNDEWLTPPELIEALGPFDLDPCAPVKRPWPTAREHFTIEDNGLLKDWSPFGMVWLNPPYGDEVGKWMGRLRAHGRGIALIFARTETEVWFEHIWGKAEGVFFFRGRLHFYDVLGNRAPANAGAPSALISYGPEAEQRLRTCGLVGHHIDMWIDSH